MTPTARTLAKLKADGWIPAVVEKWIPQTRRRKDLWNFIDVLAIRGDEIIGIQVTSGSNASARMKKAIEQPAFPVWMRGGRQFAVHAWRKAGPRGKRKTWQVRIITPEAT